MSDTWNPRTRAVHGGTRRSQYGEVSEAIFLTQGFVYDSAEAAAQRFETAGPDEFIYARYGNPTVAMFEERIAMLEGAEDGFATASGMAAVSGALTSMLKAGDRVVSSRALFGSCLYVLEDILTRYGVEVAFVDGTDLDQWRAAITPGTRAVFFESISNPTLEVVDIAAVCDLAHGVGATVLVDNVFATPVFSNAIQQGADVVIYSATKHRWTGPRPGRDHPWHQGIHPQDSRTLHEAHRRFDVAIHRLGDAQGSGNAGFKGAGASGVGPCHRRGPARARRPVAGDLPGPFGACTARAGAKPDGGQRRNGPVA